MSDKRKAMGSRKIVVRPVSKSAAERLAKRERAIGIDENDAAARWLAAHDPEKVSK